jgi:asparagine synthase (glutamine-hydrolysing)
MCGIFGYIGSNIIPIKKNVLQHRGPDDWGTINCQLENRNITLFQSRLSIIGLGEQGHQPYQKYEGKILIFNGEIYNYLDIRGILAKDFNIKFTSNTDTEVLYEAIINFGINRTLNIINGMFTFAYFDTSSEDIYIARDHLGIKPLYFSNEDDNFIFSSEIKVFFELDLRKAELNKKYIGEYFANGWIYEPNTLFKNIYKLQAGHLLKLNISSGNFTNIKYWDISDRSENKTQPNIADIIISQTISDIPIGNYFSGGIDSSIITYILKDKDLLNLNLSMEDRESSRVKLMQEVYNLDIKKIYYQKENLEVYKKLVYLMDEPISDPAIIPAFQLAKESRLLGRYVMMSGMGGDEIDAGYSRHFILNSKFLLILARLTPIFFIKTIFKEKKQRDILRLKEFAQDMSPENYFSLTSYFNKVEISSLLNSNEWFKDYRNKIVNTCSHISGKKKYYYMDIKGFLASHNLIYMDKASMAASVEVRVPFLDKDLAKFFFRDIDKKQYTGKVRLKGYLKSLIGNYYQEIEKEGFRYEINSWLVNEIDWNEIVQFFNENNLLNIKQLKYYIEEMKNNIESVSMKLWTIYTFFLWLKAFNVKIPNETTYPRP